MEANQSWDNFQNNCRRTLKLNFSSPVDCSDLLLDQYSKYMRASDSFHLIQDKQNIATILETLVNSNYKNPNELTTMLNTFDEFTIRRTWTLFCIAKKKDLQFSKKKYNFLIKTIEEMKNKKMTAVKNSHRFRKEVK